MCFLTHLQLQGDEAFETSAFQKTTPTQHNTTDCPRLMPFQQVNFIRQLEEKKGLFWAGQEKKSPDHRILGKFVKGAARVTPSD